MSHAEMCRHFSLYKMKLRRSDWVREWITLEQACRGNKGSKIWGWEEEGWSTAFPTACSQGPLGKHMALILLCLHWRSPGLSLNEIMTWKAWACPFDSIQVRGRMKLWYLCLKPFFSSVLQDDDNGSRGKFLPGPYAMHAFFLFTLALLEWATHRKWESRN